MNDMTEAFKVAKSADDVVPVFESAWEALGNSQRNHEDLRSLTIFRSEDGGSWQEYLLPLMSSDFDFELEHVSPDLAWGMKFWEEPEIGRVYLFEAHVRTSESPMPVYFREKSTDPVALVKSLVRLLTDAEWRSEATAQALHESAKWV